MIEEEVLATVITANGKENNIIEKLELQPCLCENCPEGMNNIALKN